MVETEARAALPSIESWSTIPWRELERRVYRLQKRIYQARARGNLKAVHSLQRLLMKSWSARALAVRRVTQDNQGKKTAGVDGIKSVFDGHLAYWAQRLRQHPLTNSTLGHLLRRQGGACAYCGLVFRGDDRIEIDHATPTIAGGTNRIENLQALHRHCHSAKTTHDGTLRRCAGGFA